MRIKYLIKKCDVLARLIFEILLCFQCAPFWVRRASNDFVEH